MAYHFAKKADVKETNKWCVGILNEVQTIVKDYFTFSYEFCSRNKPYIFKYEPTFDFTYYNKTQPNTEIISVQKNKPKCMKIWFLC